MPGEDGIKRAKLRAMDILTHRDKTEKELREKLSSDGYEPKEVDAALDYVRSYGYIDDERYARSYVSYRAEKKGRLILKSELTGRGIDPDLADRILDEQLTQVDEDAVIIACIEKKLRGSYPDCLPARDDEKEYAKLLRYLAGRGYSFDAIRRVMDDRGT